MVIPWLVACGGLAWLAWRQRSARSADPQPAPAPAEAPASVVDTDVNESLPLAAGSFGLAAAGALGPLPLVALSLPGFAYNARYVFVSAYHQLTGARRVNVDVMNAVVIGGFMVSGHYVLAHVPLVVSSVSRRLVSRVKDDSRGAVTDVFRQQPDTVRVLTADGFALIPTERITAGDQVIVEAGEAVPVDGVVEDGAATIDQSILTGEAAPVEVEAGDAVLALTTVCAGRVHVRVGEDGVSTVAGRIADLLDRTVHAKTGRQLRAEALVDRAMLPTLLLGAAALPVIGVSGAGAIINAPPRDNLTIVGAVGIMTYLELLSRQGILVKDGRVLEAMGEVDTVVFDKTGTLTLDEPTVGDVMAYGTTTHEVLRLAAAAEQHQSHPIARAIRRRATTDGIDAPQPDHTEVRLGHGVRVRVEGRSVLLGSERLMVSEGLTLPADAQATQAARAEHGIGLVFVAAGDRVIGAIELCATVRPKAAAVCRALRARGVSLAIISGDRQAPTRCLAEHLGIERYFAETLPADKAALIDRLQADGGRLCFVGDGMNDAIALKKAHVSVSLAGASTVATDTAQVVLMGSDLTQLTTLFDRAEHCRRTLDRSYRMVATTPILGISGALFFGMGFVPALLLNQVGFFAGLLNAVSPRLGHERIEHPALPASGGRRDCG